MKKLLLALILLFVIMLFPFVSSYFLKQDYIEIDRELKSELFEQYSSKNILVFFGYVGCLDICTPRLNELSSIYEKLKKLNIEVEVVFVNLTEHHDSELVDLFAKSFHKDFKGVYLKKKELNSLKKEFRVYSAPKLGSSFEVDHTSFLYLVKKVDSKHYLNKIYTKVPFDISVEGNNL